MSMMDYVEKICMLFLTLLCVTLCFCVQVKAETFTLVVMGDTHESTTTPNLTAYNNWIIAQEDALNIKYALHLGDAANNSGDNAVNATAMQLLDGEVEYLFTIGNHEYNDIATKTTTAFDVSYPVVNFPWIEGNFDDMHNSYDTFTVAGVDYLVLALEYCPEDAVITWADGILTANTDKKVIVSVHYYFETWEDGNNRATTADSYANACTNNGSGEDLYQNLFVNYPNIMMVLSGHGWKFSDLVLKQGGLRRVDEFGGDTFNQARQNFQADTRGNVYLRTYTIDTVTNLITVQGYSPSLDDYLTEDANYFQFNTINIPNTFQGVTMSGVTIN